VGPASLSDNSYNAVDNNSLGVLNDVLSSSNGGVSWPTQGAFTTQGAFDVLGTPEPGTLVTLATGVAALLVAAGWRMRTK